MINTFVSGIIHQKLLFCTILVLWKHNANQKCINSFVSKIPDQIKYTLSLHGKNSSSATLMEPQLITFNSDYRFSDPCILTVTFIRQVDHVFLRKVGSIIVGSFMPVTKMDYDHFIFIAPTPMHANLLLSNTFVKKIKFKVAIGIGSINQLQISTVDFFKGPNGSPKLVTLSNHTTNLFPDYVLNLQNKMVRVSYPDAISLVEGHKPNSRLESGNGKRGRWKYLFEEYLVIKFNMTYQMFHSTGGGSGRQLINGSWTGVTGDLLYERADFGIAIANTDKRIQVIGFTDTIFDNGCLTFVTGQPTKVYSTKALLWPLQLNSWIGLAAMAVTTISTAVVLTKQLKSLNLEKSSLKYFSQMLHVFAPLLEQVVVYKLRSHSLRALFAFWYMFAIILTNLYRSKLVTLLAFPIVGQIPQTFEQLAFSDYQVGFMKDGDSAFNTISNGKDPIYVKLLSKMEIIKGVNLECLDKVLNNPNYGCIAYDFDVNYLLERNFTDRSAQKLQIAKARTYNIWMGLAMQPHSIFRTNFDKALRQTRPFHLSYVWDKMDMYENIKKPKMNWWKETNQTNKLNGFSEDFDRGSVLSLKNIQGVFYLYLYLVLGSTFMFGAELYRTKITALGSTAEIKIWISKISEYKKAKPRKWFSLVRKTVKSCDNFNNKITEENKFR